MEKKSFSSESKGLTLATNIIIGSAIVIGLTLLVLNQFIFGWFSVKTVVQENDVERHAYTLANVLISSDQLVYDNGNEIFRGVFDKNKLDSISTNSKALFDKLSYPASSVSVTVEDIDSNNKWSFDGNGPKTTASTEDTAKVSKVIFPVVIRFSENEYHIGRMTLELTENSLT